ncbi:MAG: DUF167 domain-containing protein [Methanospirillum sp.]|uniref:DUF167 domain-containing protein n=1 Tax=Methanospirillum sp. TaxID=45200 RepID=UPI0023702484|nr:DUF167 domain-containing protein [Methanospirillum sp.]MDD1729466.1 DUF167 domain-containing protein [Methanospirillum sp.]
MTTPDEIRDAFLTVVGGVILTLEVSAGSKVERFPSGYNPWRQAVGIQVKAAAIEGKANKAIIHLVAETLSIPKNSVQIISGQTSSIKRIRIEGIPEEVLSQMLSARIQ